MKTLYTFAVLIFVFIAPVHTQDTDGDLSIFGTPLRSEPNPSVTSSGNVWLVAVEIHTYQNPIMSPLGYSSSGAYQLSLIFDNRQLLVSEATILLHRRATREAILNKLQTVFVSNPELSSEDLIVFYFSGHGEIDGLCPYDYSGDLRDLITDVEINDIMTKSKAKHKVCFVDACKSEVVRQSMYSEDFINALNEKRRKIKPGLAYITSTELGKEARGGLGETSYFTEYLIKGLDKEADKDADHFITVAEIFSYIQLNVKQKSKEYQIPQIRGDYDPNTPIMIIPKSITGPPGYSPPVPEPKLPCEINEIGELCITNNSGYYRWAKINDKVTPIPNRAEECFVNLKAGFLKFKIYTYLPGGGSYVPGGTFDYEVEIKPCTTTRKSIR